MASAQEDSRNASDVGFGEIVEEVNSTEARRTSMSRLEQLRREIAAGTYILDSERIAEALLRAHNSTPSSTKSGPRH